MSLKTNVKQCISILIWHSHSRLVPNCGEEKTYVPERDETNVSSRQLKSWNPWKILPQQSVLTAWVRPTRRKRVLMLVTRTGPSGEPTVMLAWTLERPVSEGTCCTHSHFFSWYIRSPICPCDWGLTTKMERRFIFPRKAIGNLMIRDYKFWNILLSVPWTMGWYLRVEKGRVTPALWPLWGDNSWLNEQPQLANIL
jgi:hypothetical protein